MLELNNVNVYFGSVHALKDMTIHVKEGEIVTLIGSNGAGKTTTLRTISSVIKAKSGSIKLHGEEIGKLSAPQIVKLGISHVPEGRRIFSNMSVMENLEMGAYSRTDKALIKEDYKRVFSKFPRLFERKNQISGTLSGGEQQMLAIGRALMSKPKLLLLDEPSMGLAPLLVKEIFSIIRDINNNGTTVLLVEQNAAMALSIANRAYVIQNGSIAFEGNAKELLKNDNVRKAYLGA